MIWLTRTVRQAEDVMKKWLALLIVSGAPGFLAHAATIDFGQTSYSGPIGQNVALDLFISGLPVGVSVGAFDLTLHFDPTVLGYQSFTSGPYLGHTAGFEVLNSATQMGAANVEVASVSLLSGAELDALQGPNFKL